MCKRRLYFVFVVVLILLLIGAKGQGPDNYGPLNPFLRGTEAHLKFEHQPLIGIVPVKLKELEHSLRRPLGSSHIDGWTSEGYSMEVVPRNLGPCSSADGLPARVAVTVTATKPEARHWVAAYSPANANISLTAPVRYSVISEADPSYLTTGTASLFLDLTCIRSDYSLILFRALPPPNENTSHARVDPEGSQSVTCSGVLSFEDADAPLKARVTPAGPQINTGKDYSGRLRVQWSSGRGQEHGPSLHWGPSGGSPEELISVAASATTFSREEMCGPPATQYGYRDVGWVHAADIEGAVPGSTVEYFLSDQTGAKSRKYTLKVPPSPGKDVRTSLAMFGDMGRGTQDDSKVWHPYGWAAGNVSESLRAEAEAGNLDAVFCFGDLSYAQGYLSQWDEWLQQIEDFASKVPFLTNLGNHEYGASRDSWENPATRSLFETEDSGGECGVPALSLFSTPGAALGGRGALWWAQSVGSILLVSMNTEVEFTTGSEQWQFLDRALGSIDRKVTPWLVFAGHRPGLIDSSYLQCSACVKNGGMDPSDGAVMAELQRHVGPLLDRHRVSLAFWGHNHAYQRHCAYDYSTGKCVQRSVGRNPARYRNPKAPVHIVVGTAGAEFSLNFRNASFNEVEFSQFGYIKLAAENRTHIVGEFIEAASGPGGAILDSFVIEQDDFVDANSKHKISLDSNSKVGVFVL